MLTSASAFPPPTAAYVHIPFCRRRCFYCDFPISVVGDRPPLSRSRSQSRSPVDLQSQPTHSSVIQPDNGFGNEFDNEFDNGFGNEFGNEFGNGFGTIAEYVEMLCSEILLIPSADLPLQTVFFGGGTPSLLTVEQLAAILQTLDRQFGIATEAEISMEIDPDTFDLARLQGYRSAGINRVSLGVQSFQAQELTACGRTHEPAHIQQAIDWIHQVGLTNFSLDLISGLPHQTLETWEDSLTQAIALQPTHLSVYDLTIEPGTTFDRWYRAGTAPLPPDETTADMYRRAQQRLTAAGFEHYEISNYARPGYQCQHNRIYWQNRSYYGFGMGAASYVQGRRFNRPRKRREYFQWVQELAVTGMIQCPVTSPQDQVLETLMVGLRLAEGISLSRLSDQFGRSIVERVLQTVQPFIRQGWVEIQPDEAGDRLRLTDPEGFLFSNVVLSTLFAALSSVTI